MKTLKRFAWSGLLLALRMATPGVLLWMAWHRESGHGEVVQLRALVMSMAALIVLLWAGVEELKSKVRDLEAPGEATRWVQRLVRERRKGGS